MFKNGSIWCPPRKNPYTAGMPEELIEGEAPAKVKQEKQAPPAPRRGQLSER